jgi:predicted acetyltransferase
MQSSAPLPLAHSPALVPPTVRCRASFVSALVEFHANDELLELDESLLIDRPVFDVYVNALHDAARPETPRPGGMVPYTMFWYADRADFVGMLRIRHHLTDELRTTGGHIGYRVRPSMRNAGHATRMLALALPFAHALGIDPLLLACDESNIASRKVIEKNGGRPATPFGSRLRYWVPTS